MRTFDEIEFSNRFVEELPGDHSRKSGTRQVPNACYSLAEPTPVQAPLLCAWTSDFAKYLGIALPEQGSRALQALAGNLVTPSMKPFAARYGGHQFGHWAGQLGDGRAITLGEITALDGSKWEAQLKGAGPTPYSRNADGRAVLRSSLREYLCSEALYHLGVPTTRALSLATTGDQVIRDLFYDGNSKPEPGAIVLRVAPTFIRFGNFEILTAQGEVENLRRLADFTINYYFPHLVSRQHDLTQSEALSTESYLAWYEEICRSTARTIAKWMGFGFVHGVMNTDNMSILGLTIDYGPYGWLEPYDPKWTPNTTDAQQRRYAFGEQPGVGMWNIMMLGRALAPLLGDAKEITARIQVYRTTFTDTYRRLLLAKLGFLEGEETSENIQLTEALHAALTTAQSDMTRFFRMLSDKIASFVPGNEEKFESIARTLVQETSYVRSENELHDPLTGPLTEPLIKWVTRYAQRISGDTSQLLARQAQMYQTNPNYVLRNYLAQQAIEGVECGDLSMLRQLVNALRTPFASDPDYELLTAMRPEWARNKPGSATLSCSS